MGNRNNEEIINRTQTLMNKMLEESFNTLSSSEIDNRFKMQFVKIGRIIHKKNSVNKLSNKTVRKVIFPQELKKFTLSTKNVSRIFDRIWIAEELKKRERTKRVYDEYLKTAKIIAPIFQIDVTGKSDEMVLQEIFAKMSEEETYISLTDDLNNEWKEEDPKSGYSVEHFEKFAQIWLPDLTVGDLPSDGSREYIQKFDRKFYERFALRYINNVCMQSNEISKSFGEHNDCDKQKEGLKKVIYFLEETGCLEDLIKSENIKINHINEYLSDENKLKCAQTPEELIKQIDELDMNNPDDIRKMRLYSRHFINKFAHNWEEYAVALIAFNCDSIEVLNNAIKGKQEKPNSKVGENLLGDRTVSQALNEAGFYSERGIGILRNEERGKKDRREIEIYTTFVPTRKKYFSKNSNFNLLRYYNKILSTLLDKYDKTKTPEENLQTIKEENLLEKLNKNNYINNFETIVLQILKLINMKNQLFQAKHEITATLLEENKKDGMLYFQNTSPTNTKDNGVVDIFAEGMCEIFGGHYGIEDEEYNNPEIQALDNIPEEVESSFAGQRNFSTHVYIPMDKITEEQKKEFSELLMIMNYIEGENELNLQSSNPNVEKLKRLYRDDVKSYNALKLTCAVGCGIDKYIEYFVPSKFRERFQNSDEMQRDAYIAEQRTMRNELAAYASYVGSKREGEQITRKLEEPVVVQNVQE